MKNLLKITTKPIKIAVVRTTNTSASKTNELIGVREQQKKQVDKIALHPSNHNKTYKQPVLPTQSIIKGNSTADVLLQSIEAAQNANSIVMPSTSRIAFMPQHIVRDSTFYSSLLKFKVEQFNEIRFEFTGDFIRVPHRGNAHNKE